MLLGCRLWLLHNRDGSEWTMSSGLSNRTWRGSSLKLYIYHHARYVIKYLINFEQINALKFPNPLKQQDLLILMDLSEIVSSIQHTESQRCYVVS